MPASPRSPAGAAPQLLLVGPMQLMWQGERVALPRSKKSRALLGYLAVTGRAHRRQRLCELFWDVADDPRGALRWTLSRLRASLPKESSFIRSDRETIAFDAEAVPTDVQQLSSVEDLSTLSDEDLEARAQLFRGELLEGLELPDFLEFSAWCVAQREQLRRVHAELLRELVRRHRAQPAVALPWARKAAQIDALSVETHRQLLELLLVQGYREEAERRYQHARRQLRELAAPDAVAIESAWKQLCAGSPATAAVPQVAPVAPPHVTASAERVAGSPQRVTALAELGAPPMPFVGRAGPLSAIRTLLSQTREQQGRRAVLITAEPGGGKTRLLERVSAEAQTGGFEVLAARAFDLERGRPFGPFVDALGISSEHLAETAQRGGRALLFERLCALVASAGEGNDGIVLVLDDVQWLDRDSAEVLQFLMQSFAGSLLVLLAARGGELADNSAMSNVVRNLQRERTLSELELEPLSAEEVAALVGEGAPVDAILRASAGNPLYVLELSRGSAREGDGPPPPLVVLIRERLARLSDGALDVLRWAAVLGYAFDSKQLEGLSELPPIELVDALEELERHALLHVDAARHRARYSFTHDVVREAVYTELSHPRKRLMHRKVALQLSGAASDPAAAHEVARHASLAGEATLGVSACITAAQYALRICANADAEALARRGLHHAAELEEKERVPAVLDLLHVAYSARTPDRRQASETVRQLAERALDLGLTKSARVGFQMLSFLRWESSSMADAHKNIMQAERVSRAAEPEERSQALAHAARCLVLLERNLGQAEAFIMEASGVDQRSGRSSAAVAFALAMIASHRGEYDEAEAAFREAQDLARKGGEPLAEFGAIEHRLMLAIDRGDVFTAALLAEELSELGARVRPGAEVAVAAALGALAGVKGGNTEHDELRLAIEGLRQADAKFELAFVLTRFALDVLSRSMNAEAEHVARDALLVSAAIGRSSEQTLSRVVLAELALQRGDDAELATQLDALGQVTESDLSATTRRALVELRSKLPA